MRPDLTIKDYYLIIINEAKNDIADITAKLKISDNIKEDCYNFLLSNYDIIKNLGICLNNYEIEWNNKSYNEEEKLYNKAHNLLKKYQSGNERILLFQIIKYCTLLKHCENYKLTIKLINNIVLLKPKQFKDIVNKYYTQVHSCILQGYAYTYNYGIGDLVINRWITTKNNKTIIDFNATNEKKRRFIAEGKPIYSETDAAWYAARGIKYNVEDYRVYRTADYMYEIDMINSRILSNSKKEFQRTEYINKKLRHKSQKEVANTCKTREDIYNTDADIKYKLNMLLYKYPNDYLKFIRNAEQNKYKRGAHNSKNRQRFQS